MLIGIYIFLAVFIAWVWVDYYRLIDIFEKEKFFYFILTFILGGASVFIVFQFSNVLDSIGFDINGSFFNDLLYSIFGIGLIEEIAKLIPFLIIYYSFRKQLNEPIDYLAIISISALGFSAVENALYFNKYGPEIINGRAILSTVTHMFDTSLIAYGIIRNQFYHKEKNILRVLLYVLLAAISHGFYDFWLIYEEVAAWGGIVTIVYFLVTISIFASILNNALNNSSFFTHKKVINSDKIAKRLIFYYSIIFVFQFGLIAYLYNGERAAYNFRANLNLQGFIIVITCLRLSRFKLIQNRWNPIRLELPFQIVPVNNFRPNSQRVSIKVKGDSYNESIMNIYLEENSMLIPVSNRSRYLVTGKLINVERRIYLKNDETFYLINLLDQNSNKTNQILMIKAKNYDMVFIQKKYPIVAILEIPENLNYDDPNTSIDDFNFMEWAYLKPIKEN